MITSPVSRLRGWTRLVSLGFLSALLITLGSAHVGWSQPAKAGQYFADVDLKPLLEAKRSLLSEDPAAVLVFTSDATGLETITRFDAWQRQPHKYSYAIYGILVQTGSRPVEIVEEQLRQRGLKVPVFATQDDLLEGKSLRVFLLSGGAFRELPEFDPAVLESRMNDLAQRMGAEPSSGNKNSEETSATAAGEGDQPRRYVNRRYGFQILFPPGWGYRTAQNGDGAVGKPSATSPLDFRVWGTPNYEETDQGMRRLTLKAYLAQHIDFVGENAKSDVRIERKLVVQDDSNVEGRDYTYAYNKKGEGDSAPVAMKGRVQIFELNGAFKVANVEGPATDFDRNESMIEEFFYSFRPVSQQLYVPLPPTR